MEEFFGSLTDWERTLLQAIKLVLSFVIALPVALDREKTTRIMGLRTFPLVSLASCGYILIAIAIAGSGPETKARIIQGVITGIGFIGGGAILKNEDGVKGTATAASIWATGAVGVAVAFGFLDIAILIAGFTFMVLRLFTTLKNNMHLD